ncbi:cell division protein SepF [Xylocopilactobacillus apicola]|uniref:Cell division protein SepF n=1 Tax=Xylocopilactobacillus apicola TaxID=2932184 RepID=A0AAU9DQX2_9LACO|nr:cell division protein SepF [Xylocopilactobacillus apicola]BDR58309.1 hypothetical protein XA3_07500 [Xylocopilactobacillus apicola]
MAFNKSLLKNIFGSEDEEDYEEESFEEESLEDEPRNKVIPMNKQKGTKKSVMAQNRIIVVEPRIYSDAAEIVNKLKDNFAIVVNFEKIEAEQAKRIIDFLSGATCAMDGVTQKVSPQIYLCTPNNFEVQANLSDSE